MNKLRFIFAVMAVWLVSALTVSAQSSGVQEYTGTVTDDADTIFFDLPGLSAGDVVYATVRADNSDLDTYLLLADSTGETVLAENDDIYRGETNSALVHRIQADGDYLIGVSRYDESTSGDFVLQVGVNAPEVFPMAETRDVQESTGTVTDEDEFVFFDLFDLREGDTIYAYVEADNSDLDTYLSLGDFDFDEVFAENDDIGFETTNSALFYTIPADGDYSIAVSRYDETSSGDFRLLLGVNTPEVLSGEALLTGNNSIAAPSLTEILTETRRPQVQQFRGAITEDEPFRYYDLFGMEAGQTIYIYAEGIDGLDTYVGIGDIDFVEIFSENDDIDFDAGNLNSALEYTFPEDGDYSIAVTSAFEDEFGSYRLLLGFNAPDVLNGTASPTNDLIASPFNPGTGEGGALSLVDCESVQEDRPVLSGPVQQASNDRFIVHYTTQGVDAATDAFAQQIADVMNDVWAHQIEQVGWPSPPADCGEGGDTRYDIYVLEVEQLNMLGYAQPEGLLGDNPASPATETYAAYSYLVLDNDFASSDVAFALMQATAAHEFHHGVQFGYDLNDAADWYYEATSTWIETQTFPDAQDATGYVQTLFNAPGLCPGNTVNDETGLRLYAEWLLIDSLVQDHGADVVLQLWDLIASEEGMDPLYSLLEKLGTTPQEALQRYAVRNLLMDYSLSSLFNETVRIDARLTDTGRALSRSAGVQELGVNYLAAPLSRGTYTFSVQEDGLELLYVGISGSDALVYHLGEKGSVNTLPFDDGYLLVFNSEAHTQPDECNATRWTVTVTEGGEPQEASYSHDASQFVRP